MAWMACRGCSTRYAVGLLRCPQCGAESELYAVPEEIVEAEQEATVPKISVEGGPSSALGGEVEPAAVGDEVQSPAEAPTDTDDTAVAESSPTRAEESTPDVESAPEPDATPAPAAKKRVAKKTTASSES